MENFTQGLGLDLKKKLKKHALKWLEMQFNTTCFYAGQDPPQLEFFTFIFNNFYGFLKISTSTIVRYFCVMK